MGLRLALCAALLLASQAAWADGIGLSMGVEGGVSRFNGPLGENLKPGAAWGVRADLRAKPWLGVALAYTGSMNRLARSGDDSPPLLVRDGASALARLSARRGQLEPFAEAGIGIGRLSFSRGDAGALYRSDTTPEVPLAAGVLLHAGALDVGLRLGHVFLLDNEAYRGGGGNLWIGALSLGANLF
jgi:hypothetical protein